MSIAIAVTIAALAAVSSPMEAVTECVPGSTHALNGLWEVAEEIALAGEGAVLKVGDGFLVGVHASTGSPCVEFTSRVENAHSYAIGAFDGDAIDATAALDDGRQVHVIIRADGDETQLVVSTTRKGEESQTTLYLASRWR